MIQTERIAKALKLASQAHAGQLDKSGKPYIDHPIAVAESISEEYSKVENWRYIFTLEDLIVAALLHDTVEDTPLTLDAIEQEFGLDVRLIVDRVSRRRDATRKETYSEFIKRAKAHPGARIVKLADVRHNLSRIHNLPPAEQDIARRYNKAVKELTSESFNDKSKIANVNEISDAIRDFAASRRRG